MPKDYVINAIKKSIKENIIRNIKDIGRNIIKEKMEQMRNVNEDKTPFWKRFINYSWVFEKWYEKLILVALVMLGIIKLFGFFI